MKRKILFLILSIVNCFFLLNTQTAYSQTQNVNNVIDVIAKISANGYVDRSSELLTQAGFIVPTNLQANWNQFRAYRKIETAYWIAESKSNGDKFLALLSKNLSQQYESVAYEQSLKRFLNMKINPNENLFSTVSATFDYHR